MKEKVTNSSHGRFVAPNARNARWCDDRTNLLPMASVASSGLRNLSLSIKPPWVRRGQEAQLHCQYEMEGAPLYSVKWYRGTLEFYRYSPFENPPAKIFPFTGIKVDI
uniref:Ig-like domain-containing protein n=1 Tax=Anopheles christyi TaxID=43041 RepID=A0A182JXS8_9DIPT